MENKEQDTLHTLPEDDKSSDTKVDESVEERRLKHDADSGSDGTSDAILQKENLIDPGNEHRRNDADTDSSSAK